MSAYQAGREQIGPMMDSWRNVEVARPRPRPQSSAPATTLTSSVQIYQQGWRAEGESRAKGAKNEADASDELAQEASSLKWMPQAALVPTRQTVVSSPAQDPRATSSVRPVRARILREEAKFEADQGASRPAAAPTFLIRKKKDSSRYISGLVFSFPITSFRPSLVSFTLLSLSILVSSTLLLSSPLLSPTSLFLDLN
ncbi:unnamed protein product [Protopolystoma xenopodis]|uniref:Uncharacterized protein n=1 Tax=Protopolystoma xenopodis TaxID=117903 RepID=A0A3S5FD10_9PLAT|nr:unnamed protein product [Protopolystoma xenopodis]